MITQVPFKSSKDPIMTILPAITEKYTPDSSEPIFDADFSLIKNYLNQLKETGILDFSTFFEKHPEELIDCKRRITCIGVNEECMQLFGCEERRDIKVYFPSFFNIESLPVFRDLLVALADGQNTFEAGIPFYDVNHVRKEVLIRVTIQPEYEVTLSRVQISLIRLIPENYIPCDLYKAWRFLDQLIENTHTPIIGWSPAYTISLINKAGSLLLGLSSEQVIGQKIESIFPEYNREQSVRLLQKVETNSGLEGTMIPILQKSGDIRSVVWNSFKITGASGNSITTIATGQDVTEQIWALDYLKKYIAELTEKNNELTQVKTELEYVNQNLDVIIKKRTREIEELLIQKDDFITQIGHDLKTPLTPIIAILPILKKKEQDPKKREYLDMAIRNANHIQDLILSILQMARLNRAYFPALGTKLSISYMIDELIINNEYEILKKHLMVENHIPAELGIRISPIDFDTVFGNILDNAIKYSRRGGEITFFGEKTDEGIVIQIRDTGIGLIPEEASHVFEKFYKADPSRHDKKSYGLGLSISQKIVKQNGGKILVKSEGRDLGTSFIIIFPHWME